MVSFRNQAPDELKICFGIDQRPVGSVEELSVIREVGDPGLQVFEIAVVFRAERLRLEPSDGESREVDEDVFVLGRHLGCVDDPRVPVVRHHEGGSGKIRGRIIDGQRMSVLELSPAAGGVAGVEDHRNAAGAGQFEEGGVARIPG